jgi:hypothetical protein
MLFYTYIRVFVKKNFGTIQKITGKCAGPDGADRPKTEAAEKSAAVVCGVIDTRNRSPRGIRVTRIFIPPVSCRLLCDLSLPQSASVRSYPPGIPAYRHFSAFFCESQKNLLTPAFCYVKVDTLSIIDNC